MAFEDERGFEYNELHKMKLSDIKELKQNLNDQISEIDIYLKKL